MDSSEFELCLTEIMNDDEDLLLDPALFQSTSVEQSSESAAITIDSNLPFDHESLVSATKIFHKKESWIWEHGIKRVVKDKKHWKCTRCNKMFFLVKIKILIQYRQ